MKNLNIQHDVSNHLFFTKVKGGVAKLDYDRHKEDYLDYKHTYVPEESRNQGVASSLAEAALNFAEARNLKVKPTCPFVKSYIEHNEEYQDLVLDE